MATVNTQLTVDDLYRLIGVLADGRDPLAPLLPDEEQRYAALGQAIGEAVAVRARMSQLDAQIIASRRHAPSGQGAQGAAPAAQDTGLATVADDDGG